jgi:hypothetical protein
MVPSFSLASLAVHGSVYPHMAALFRHASFAINGYALRCCFTHTLWLHASHLVLSTALGCTQVVCFCSAKWLRSLFMVRSIGMATLSNLGSVTSSGYALHSWFCLDIWLRSRSMVPSAKVAALPKAGCLDSLGYASAEWFIPARWLRSPNMVHSTFSASLLHTESVNTFGYALSVWLCRT